MTLYGLGSSGFSQEYPCSAQPPSICAAPKRRVSLQCRTAKYPCSAQLQSILAVSSHQISLQGPTEKYPCNAQAQTIPGVPNSKASIFLQCICSAARKTVEGGRKMLHFLCNNGFRVGMLEVNLFYCYYYYYFLLLLLLLELLLLLLLCLFFCGPGHTLGSQTLGGKKFAAWK